MGLDKSRHQYVLHQQCSRMGILDRVSRFIGVVLDNNIDGKTMIMKIKSIKANSAPAEAELYGQPAGQVTSVASVIPWSGEFWIYESAARWFGFEVGTERAERMKFGSL